MFKKIMLFSLILILCFAFVACSSPDAGKKDDVQPPEETKMIDFGESYNKTLDDMAKYLNAKYNFNFNRNSFTEMQNITTTNENYIAELLEEGFISEIDIENYHKGEIEICTPYIIAYFKIPSSDALYACIGNIANEGENYDNVQSSEAQKLVWESLPIAYNRNIYNISYSCRSATLYSKGIDMPFFISEKISDTDILSVMGSDKYKDLDFEIDFFIFDEQGIGEISEELQNKFNSIYRFTIYDCKDENYIKSIDNVHKVTEQFIKNSSDKIADSKSFGYSLSNE